MPAALLLMLMFLSADIFKINFFKKIFRNTIRVSNSLDPDQDRHSVLLWVQTVCKGYQQTTLAQGPCPVFIVLAKK